MGLALIAFPNHFLEGKAWLFSHGAGELVPSAWAERCQAMMIHSPEHPAHLLGSGITAPQRVGCTWASAFYKAMGIEVTLCVGASGSYKGKLSSNMADYRCSRKEDGQGWSL